MKRFQQILLIVTFRPLCWLGMQVVHELGHVLGAKASGGTVSQVVLEPLSLSRTESEENPSPHFVAAMGAVLGVALPVVAALVAQARAWSGWYLVRFFAGFCLVANGIYLSAGAFADIGDARDIMSGGGHTRLQALFAFPLMQLFGLIAVPAGFYLWHGLGPHFGLGKDKRTISAAAAWTSCILLVVVVAAELLIGLRG